MPHTRPPRMTVQISGHAAEVAAARSGVKATDLGSALKLVQHRWNLPTLGSALAYLIYQGARQAAMLAPPSQPAPPDLTGLAALARRSSQ